MPSNELLLDVLKRFASTLAAQFDVSEVLYELGDRMIEIMEADGAGVSLADDGGLLRFAVATDERVAVLETVQQETQQGPCCDAYRTAEAVLVEKIDDQARWGVFCSKAGELGFAAVAGIPMRLNGARFGVVNIYQQEPRTWTVEDVDAALVLADIATNYVVHSSELDKARRASEQLERALESRVLVEQAKGMLAGERKISVEKSFEIMRNHARRNNATLRSVAEAIVNLGLRP